jgi:ubiquitin carboxyl-terminal hydrolase 7
MEIQVATEKNFSSFQGFDIVPWKGESDSPALPKTYRILRTMTIADFTKLVADDLNVDPAMLRPWSMVNRQNGTVRPDQVIAYTNFSVEEAANKYGTKTANFRIFMEETDETDADDNPVFGDANLDLHGIANNRPLMLFLKHFDPEKQSLYGVSTFYAAWQDKVQDISPQILKLLNWPAGTTIKLYEEIKHNMIEAMKPKVSLAASEIQDGDIITVQKALSEKEIATISANGRFTDVREFYEYLLNKCDITFSPRSMVENDDATFTLTLSKKMSYDQFSAKVGEHLGVDPTHLRFSTVNAGSGRPKTTVKRTATLTLSNVLYPTSYGTYTAASAPKPDQLLYEVLEMSLQELETRKTIKVIWLPEGISKEVRGKKCVIEWSFSCS